MQVSGSLIKLQMKSLCIAWSHFYSVPANMLLRNIPTMPDTVKWAVCLCVYFPIVCLQPAFCPGSLCCAGRSRQLTLT